jgi:hypothetical protein
MPVVGQHTVCGPNASTQVRPITMLCTMAEGGTIVYTSWLARNVTRVRPGLEKYGRPQRHRVERSSGANTSNKKYSRREMAPSDCNSNSYTEGLSYTLHFSRWKKEAGTCANKGHIKGWLAIIVCRVYNTNAAVYLVCLPTPSLPVPSPLRTICEHLQGVAEEAGGRGRHKVILEVDVLSMCSADGRMVADLYI